ncbi:unnamed protein product [Caenorhabditis angaria]|uniref:Major facilitator superfamily (MFS) profile domain-containing protein n=1 Tax=Caenorhabditis angaria TaxID=860376 RepID=A0A9P1NAS7_9PELO|nr:unnamed protein product [Caenorhabditis angaria]
MFLDLPVNLLYTIFVYSFIGIYTEIQFMIFSTLTESINYMHNLTLEHHYGIKATEANIALMSSIINLSGGVGFIISIFFLVPKSDLKGRKYLCVYSRFFLGFLSSLLQLGAAVFQASELYIIAQCIFCAQIPIRMFITALFICECAPDKNRGFASVALIICDVIGQVIMYSITSTTILGGPSTWFIFPLICTIASVALFMTTMKLPESPKWLVKMNRFDEAKKSILFYHGPECDLNTTLISMLKEKNLTQVDKISLSEIWKNDTLREALKLILAVNAFTMLSPIAVEKIYTVQIHNSAGFEITEVLNINLILSIIFIPTRFAGTLLIDYFGRRPVLFIAAALTNIKIWLMSIALSLAYFEGFSWLSKSLTIVSDSVAELIHGTGSYALMPLLVSELFPPSARTVVSQCILVLTTFSNIPTLFSFPIINSIFPPGFYIPFIFIQPIIVGYLYIYLPETKARAVCDIIDSFDQEVTSRRNTLQDERRPLIIRDRTMSLAHKRGSFLLSTSKSRALTYSYDQKMGAREWNNF